MKTLAIIGGAEVVSLLFWYLVTIARADNSDAKATAGFVFMAGAAALVAVDLLAGVGYGLYRLLK